MEVLYFCLAAIGLLQTIAATLGVKNFGPWHWLAAGTTMFLALGYGLRHKRVYNNWLISKSGRQN